MAGMGTEAAAAAPLARSRRRRLRFWEEDGQSAGKGTGERRGGSIGAAPIGSLAELPRRCQRSCWAKGRERRAGADMLFGRDTGGSCAGSRGGTTSKGGPGGVGKKLTKMLTGGGDLRRASLRPFRTVDLERSGSLDMEEDCPMAVTKEWANVSREEQMSLSMVVL